MLSRRGAGFFRFSIPPEAREFFLPAALNLALRHRAPSEDMAHHQLEFLNDVLA